MTPSTRVAQRIVVAEPGRVELVDAEPPAPLAANEVRGRTLATLVSPGTELASAFAPADAAAVAYPVGVGYSAVFEVAEIGADVHDVSVGDVVFSQGAHASVQTEAAERVLRVPAGLAPSAAVFARMIAVPMAALVTTSARPGDRVGVCGLGLVGHLAATAFRAAGYRVSAWDPLAARREGLPSDIRVSAAPPAGEEFELVVEASGHDGAAVAAAHAVAKNGELVLTGTPWARRSDASAHELLHRVFHGYVRVRSGWEWQLPMHAEDFRGGSVTGNFRQALAWLASGAIEVDALADVRAPEEAQRAYAALADRSAARLTVVFDWT